MASPESVTLATLQARSVTGSGSSVDLGTAGDRSVLELVLLVVAVSGTTPTAEVFVETSDDDTNWREVARLGEAVSTLGRWSLLVGDCARYVRASWTVTGTTPSLTFMLSGYSHQVYATRRDMVQLGMGEDELAQVPEEDKLRALLAATAEAATFLSRHFSLPLVSWGQDLTLHVARMACYHAAMVDRRLYDDAIADAYTAALKYLRSTRDVGTVVDTTPEYDQDAAEVYDDDPRGW